MCASCHIGDQDRDMNHDIIAAGHPPLYYEFASYHQRLPKHWREPQSSNTDRFEAYQWLVGQIAALDASLTLLEGRARKSLPTSQWPEFSIYECSSCHQQLRPGSIDYSLPRNEVGVAKLSQWNRFGITELLAARESAGTATEADQRLTGLLRKLEQVSILKPDVSPELVAEVSHAARQQLDQWLNSSAGLEEMHSMTAERLRTMLQHSGKNPDSLGQWESAAQFYLASVAARSAWPDGMNGRALATARDLRSALTFKPGTNSLQSELWRATSGFKNLPTKAGFQHWNAISSP